MYKDKQDILNAIAVTNELGREKLLRYWSLDNVNELLNIFGMSVGIEFDHKSLLYFPVFCSCIFYIDNNLYVIYKYTKKKNRLQCQNCGKVYRGTIDRLFLRASLNHDIAISFKGSDILFSRTKTYVEGV